MQQLLRSFFGKWHLSTIIIVLILVIYAPVLMHEFVSIDDRLLILDNWRVTQASSTIFTSYDPELYIPLTLLTYQIEYALVGETPWLFHLTNIVLHVICSLLVYSIAFRLTKDARIGFLTGALFAIHPFAVEVVSWASSRKDLLSSMFFFAALLQYVRYREEEHSVHFHLSAFLFLCALLSKVTVVMLPVILVLIDWYQRKGNLVTSVREKIPYFVLSILFGIIALIGKSENITQLSLVETLIVWMRGFLNLFFYAVYPVPLRLLYIQPIPLDAAMTMLTFAILFAVIAGVFAVRKHRIIPFVFLFVLCAFLPNIGGLIKAHTVISFSDRFGYLPLFAIALCISIGFFHLVDRHRSHSKILMSIPGVLCIVLLIQSSLLRSHWQNSEKLYRHVLSYEPDSSWMMQNLGAELVAEKRWDEAREIYERGARAENALPNLHVNLGDVYKRDGRREEALEQYMLAVEAAEKLPIVSLADLIPYYRFGEFAESEGKVTAALGAFQKAAERGAHMSEPHYNLGLQYQKRNQPQPAYDAYTKAVSIRTYYVPALYNLAAVSAELGKIDEAIEYLELVQRLHPGYEKTQEHLVNLRRMVR